MNYIENYTLFTERRNVGKIYHFTSLINTYNIIMRDEMESYREADPIITKTYNKTDDNMTTFSFTRDKNFHKYGSGNIDTILTCRLDFDGSKISDKYMIRPYHWKGDSEVLDKTYGFEAEQVVITHDNYIKNISKYLDFFTVPDLQTFKFEFKSYANGEPSDFYKLEDIVHQVGYDEDEFSENENEFDDEMIKKTYDYIIGNLHHESPVKFEVKRI